MDVSNQIKKRRAIEALRSGVPNRDAVLALGCAQSEIESKFRQQLENAKTSVTSGSMAQGLLVEGGFGAGKSHLLEYLLHLASDANFVCSKMVISKETPLYDPVKMYRAAINAATVPGRRGAALTEICTQLDFNSDEYAALYKWINRQKVNLSSIFAATLFLFERMPSDPEARNRILGFWSGEPISVSEVRKYLRACSEDVKYQISSVPQKTLALERFKFAARLMVAAGYSGWVLLIDEVELIGRYSLQQRAKSYAEIARWKGELEDANIPGLTTVLAITDDFQSAILDGKDDKNKVPLKLREKNDDLLASQAERGLRILQRKKDPLIGPNHDSLQRTYNNVRSIHSEAYNWAPPSITSGEKLSTTRMREYVKGWITEWDLRRLDSAYSPDIEVTELKQHYSEDSDLEIATEEEPGDTNI